jgi:hypothetical protein
MKYLRAYKKDQLRFKDFPAKYGDVYVNEERRFVKKFPFFKKVLITYTLIGDYWIEAND